MLFRMCYNVFKGKGGARLKKANRMFKLNEMHRTAIALGIMLAVAILINSLVSRQLLGTVLDINQNQQMRIINNSARMMDSFLADVSGSLSSVEGSAALTSLSGSKSISLGREQEAVSELSRSLILIKDRYPWFKDGFIYVYNSKYLLTPEGYTEADVYFLNRGETYTESLDKTSGEVRRFSFTRRSAINEETPGTLYLTQSFMRAGRPIGLAMLAIDEAVLLQYLSGTGLDPQSRMLAVQKGAIMLGRDIEGIRQTESASQMMVEELEKLGTVASQPSSVIEDLQYYILTPKSAITGIIPGIFAKANLALVAVAVLLIVGTLLLLRRVYRPIGRMTELARSVVLSGDRPLSEGDLVHKAFETIWRNHAQMTSALSDSAPYTREGLLYRLLLNEPVDEKMLALADADNKPATPLSPPYWVYVLQMAFSAEDSELYFAQEETDLIARLKRAAGPLLVGLVKSGVNELTLVCRHDKLASKQLQATLVKEVERLRQVQPRSYFVLSVAAPRDTINEIGAAYIAARQQIAKRRVKEEDSLLLHSPSRESHERYLLSPNRVEQLVHIKDENEFKQTIGQILSENAETDLSIGGFIQLCTRINGVLSRRLQAIAPLRQEALLAIDTFNTLYHPEQLKDILMSNVELLSSCLRETLCEGCENLGDEAPEAAQPALIHRLTAYVDEHFNQNINLNTVAYTFGYSVGYLSRYFKKTRGITFTDYLNSRKVEEACRLLKREDIHVKEAADLAGFSSVSQFISTFSQYIGVTPGVYKRQHAQWTQTEAPV